MNNKVTNVILIILLLFVISGCASPKNLPRYIWGTYVHQPGEGEEGNYEETFECSYDKCYENVLDILNEMEIKIRYKSKKEHLILAWYFDKLYKSCIDTTKVSIIFTEEDPEYTRINVACGNYELAEFASKEIFSRMKDKLSTSGR